MQHVHVYLNICHLQCCFYYYSFYYYTATRYLKVRLLVNFIVYKDYLFLFNIVLFIGRCEM